MCHFAVTRLSFLRHDAPEFSVFLNEKVVNGGYSRSTTFSFLTRLILLLARRLVQFFLDLTVVGRC